MVQLEAIVGSHAVILKREMCKFGIQVLVCMLEPKCIFKSIESLLKKTATACGGLYSMDEITENIKFLFLETI